MSEPVELPKHLELVGYGLLLGGVCGLLPTPVGAPAALLLGVACMLLGWWLP